jgi:hypothetical protein
VERRDQAAGQRMHRVVPWNSVEVMWSGERPVLVLSAS